MKTKNYDLKRLETELAAELRQRIIKRTEDGLDYLGRPFALYSKEYADRKGVSMDAVDLKLSVSMLENFNVTVEISEQPYELVKGMPYMVFPEIKVSYGFNDIEDTPSYVKSGHTTTPMKKYLWNAQGFDGYVKRKDRTIDISKGEGHRYTPKRDFIGLDSNDAEYMFPYEILNDILNDLI
jgi:hypothetical protein